MSSALPPSLGRLARLDPALAEELGAEVRKLVVASEALVWAQSRLPALIAAGAPSAVLDVVVREAVQLTGAPRAWALTWTGSLSTGKASFRALASAGEARVPAPGEISRTVVGQVVEEGRPIWTDDALADVRFESAQSVQGYLLRSVGCAPIGKQGVLYLHDPEVVGRFDPTSRARVAALCSLASAFLGTAPPTKRPPAPAVPGLVGDAPPMRELFAAIHAFAPMPWPALVLGPSGTGKEAVARALHDQGPRAREPFVPVNCGAIPDDLAESTLFGHERGAFTGADRRRAGLVERAGSGTLFLDEVGELSPRAQVKLLRLLQEHTFERVGGEDEHTFAGRVVAATHRTLDEASQRDTFRDDLFHRLAACVLRVPALEERRSDIPALAEHLLERALGELRDAPPLTLSAGALPWLEARSWPGNVRELENAIRGAVARAIAAGAPLVRSEHFDLRDGPSPDSATAPSALSGDLATATEAFQRAQVLTALQACGGNRTNAAARLGVSRQWLHRLLTRWEPGPGEVSGE